MTSDDTPITGRIDDHEFRIEYISRPPPSSHELTTAPPSVSEPPQGTIYAASNFPRESVRIGDIVDIDIAGDTPFTHVTNARVDCHEFRGEDVTTRIDFREYVVYGDDFKE